MIYLASQSPSRQELLRLSGIPFQTVSHQSDECVVVSVDQFDRYVLAIAQDKMKHVHLPENAQKKSAVIVMTADTLIRTQSSKQILGKPEDRDDGLRMLSLLREEPAEVVTATVIEKKMWEKDMWRTQATKTIVLTAVVEFHVPEKDVDFYLTHEPGALQASGCGIVERYGLNFLKTINGSFTAVLGLPLYEVRCAVEEMSNIQ